MSSTTLWAEISIAGFAYLLAAFFLTLRIAGIRNLLFLAQSKDYAAIIVIIVAATSYTLGILAHRIIPITLVRLRRFIVRQLKRVGTIEKVIRRLKPRGATEENEPDLALHHAHLVKVWQYGSERLHKELDFQFSLLALFTSLTVAMPVLGASTAIWLSSSSAKRATIPVLIVFFVLGVAFFAARRIQRGTLKKIQQAAFSEIEKLSMAQVHKSDVT